MQKQAQSMREPLGDAGRAWKGDVRKTSLRLFSLLQVSLIGFFAATAHAQTFGCTPSLANPVVCENSKPGNPSTEWDVNGAGDVTIQGFATDISVNQGQTIRFKVKTTANTYRLDIYRMGYYGGFGARRVATVQPSATLPQNQPSCVSDVSTGLVDCGNWAESASWAVPANATSGIYIARLVRQDTGGASHIVFIVRADTGNSAVLFQTSDTTWQAYNTYGGNSLYSGSPAGRAFKVSYNRPFVTRAVSSGQSWVFNAEYPMVRWLEANGYDVSYSTGVDTDRNGANILLSHKVFLSVGHDEYWSAAQRANVEGARSAGVSLAFFSGNEIFWKTRWEFSIDGLSTAYRTLVCYKETQANQPIDPNDPPTWTGTWRDPRFSPPADGGRPENALSGNIFVVNGPRNDAIEVPAAYGSLRFWRNTSIATLAPNATATFPVGTLGYEWDQDLDNGFRPAGLFELSSTTLDVSGNFLLDYGSTYGGGVATHSLTLYRASSGALVFGAGTVQWSWGLDGNHDNGNLPPDPNMKQAMVNLFADMGVQPATLQPGLVAASASPDRTPPTSLITSPAAGASVQIGSSVTISGTAADSGGGVIGGVEVSTDGGTTWHRATGFGNWTYSWKPGALGNATLKSRAVDDSGNLENPSGGITVTIVPNTTPPVITNVQTPAFTSAWSTITWNTDKAADSQVDYGTTTSYGSSTQLDPALVTNHAQTLNGLSANTLYHFRVRSRDTYGNVAVTGDFTFTTSASNSTTTVTFDARPAGQFLSGQYPTGVIDWGNTSWFVSGPFGPFTGNSVSFANGSIFTGSFAFVTSLRLITIDAYNGGTVLSTITLSCPGQINKQATLAVGQLLTIATGWTDACSPVTINSTNGWDTNFNRLVIDSPVSAPPVISAVQAGQVGCAGATITWNTDKPSDSQVAYGTTTAYGSNTTLNTTLVTAHSVPLSGLAPNTLYHYQVLSKDSAGHLAASGDFTFRSATSSGIPPNLSGIQALANTNASVYILWNTNTSASSQVDYGTTTTYGSSTSLDPTQVTSHSVLLTGLAPSTLYHYRVRSADLCGNLANSPDFTFMTSNVPPNTIWSSTATPKLTSQADTSAIEVGVKFRSDVNGYITGLRFYKGSVNTGTHVGNIWAVNGTTGTLLANATFTNETTTGWQQVNFAAPVAITANTTYVASYHTNSGGYADDPNYFSGSGIDNAPLHALKDGVSGPNGVYLYGVSGFPTQTYLGSNYWVDVAFVPYADTTPPIISAVQAATTTCGSATIGWTTDKQADSQVEYGTTTAYGSSTALDSTLVATHSVSLPGLAPSTLYHYRVKSKSSPINLATSADFTFTTAPADGVPLTFSAVQAVAVTNSSAYITWTTNKPSSTQVDYGTTTAYGASTPLDSTLVTSHTVLLTGLTPSTLYHFRVDGKDLCGILAASTDFTFMTSNAPPNTIWSNAATPVVLSQGDTSALEVGVKFRSDVNGYITGLRFYKGSANTGTHVGNLWSITGTLLASAAFTNETSTGWQQVNFAAPLAITANTVYVASYHTNVGGYSVNQNYFASAGVDNAPLHALKDGVSGGNGVYLYSGPSAFPTQTFSSTNYWVDVAFAPGYDATPPIISAVQAATTTCGSATIGWTTDKQADSQVEYGTTTAYGLSTALDSTLVTTHSVSLPGLAPSTLYHYRVKSKSSPINLATSTDFTFTTAPADGVPLTFSAVQAVAVTNSSAYITWTTNKPSSSQVDYGTTTSYGTSTTPNPTLVTSHTALLTGLTASTLYHFRVDGMDLCGGGASSGDFSFTTSNAPANTIWNATATPAIASQSDAQAIEVGVKFRTDVNAYVTGVRFYKGSTNTGTHVGNFWSATGTLLATATFTNESSTGWQQVTFAAPVAITANTVYIVSYHTNTGGYSLNQNYFASAGFDNAPLHALQDGVSGGNGVYLYSAASAFPTQTFSSSNYWVDVVVVPR